MSKKPDIIALRALRKASHISRKATTKGSHFFGRVENKATRIIVDKTGAMDGGESIGFDDFVFKSFPQITPVHPALPLINQKPSVTVFAFLDPRGFYGGIATLLIVAASLAKKLDYDLRIAQTANYSKDNQVLKFLKSNGIDIAPSRFSTVNLSNRTPYNYAYLPLHEDDVVVVSAWWDAHVASKLPLSKKYLYLIQDYEPIFYNNGDAQQFAESTYHNDNFIPLCNTKLMKDFFNAGKYKYIHENANYFEPAVGKENTANVKKNGKKKMFLYGRPSVHRNMFFSALKAIDKAFSDERLNVQDWEIYCAGQGNVPNIRFQSGITIKNLGKMDLGDYYKFASSIDVTLSPMLAPHPNYPTLELASLGSMVVSTKYANKQDLGFYSPNIMMANPTIDSLADNIIKAALTKPNIREANFKKNNISTNWNAALNQPLNEIVKELS
jgi:hypothetical protein